MCFLHLFKILLLLISLLLLMTINQTIILTKLSSKKPEASIIKYEVNLSGLKIQSETPSNQNWTAAEAKSQDQLSCQDEIDRKVLEMRRNFQTENLLGLTPFRNRATVLEARVDCLTHVNGTSEFLWKAAMINQGLHFPGNQDLLIEDRGQKDQKLWKFDPEWTGLHFEFKQTIRPAVIVFEYPEELKDILRSQEIKVRLIGMERLTLAGLKENSTIHWEEIEEFMFGTEDKYSIDYKDQGRAFFARLCWKPLCQKSYNVIKLNLFSYRPNQPVEFAFSRIKIMEALK